MTSLTSPRFRSANLNDFSFGDTVKVISKGGGLISKINTVFQRSGLKANVFFEAGDLINNGFGSLGFIGAVFASVGITKNTKGIFKEIKQGRKADCSVIVERVLEIFDDLSTLIVSCDAAFCFISSISTFSALVVVAEAASPWFSVVAAPFGLAGLALDGRDGILSHRLLNKIERMLGKDAYKDKVYSAKAQAYPIENVKAVLELIRDKKKSSIDRNGVPGKYQETATEILDDWDDENSYNKARAHFEGRVLVEHLRGHLGRRRCYKAVAVGVNILSLTALGFMTLAMFTGGTALPIIAGVLAVSAAVIGIGMLLYKYTALKPVSSPRMSLNELSSKSAYVTALKNIAKNHDFFEGKIKELKRRALDVGDRTTLNERISELKGKEEEIMSAQFALAG